MFDPERKSDPIVNKVTDVITNIFLGNFTDPFCFQGEGKLKVNNISRSGAIKSLNGRARRQEIAKQVFVKGVKNFFHGTIHPASEQYLHASLTFLRGCCSPPIHSPIIL